MGSLTADFAIRVTSALGSWKLSMPSELALGCARVDMRELDRLSSGDDAFPILGDALSFIGRPPSNQIQIGYV